MTRGELEEAIGWAAESSLRAAVASLCDFGALTTREPGAPQQMTTELTPAGHDLLPLVAALERWLWEMPGGSISLEEDAGRAIVRILLAAWDSALVRTLGGRPRSLATLNDQVHSGSESTLRRRLAKLCSTGLVSRVGSGRNAAYEATDWLRRAMIPLALAGRWELRHGPGPPRLNRTESETAFLLGLPLVEFSPRASGRCTLAVVTSDCRAGPRPVAGVLVEMERGEIASLAVEGADDPPTWALGTAEAWLDAVIDGDPGAIRIGGAQPGLARHLVTKTRQAFRCDA